MSAMASVLNRLEIVLGADAILQPQGDAPGVLVISADPHLRDHLLESLDKHWSKVKWVSGADAAKRFFAGSRIAACLCGFSLADGTYKEVVKHAKKQAVATPVIIVSTPGRPNEYQEYLAAMNAGAFDFLCFPYQKREVERIIGLAVLSFHRSAFMRHS